MGFQKQLWIRGWLVGVILLTLCLFAGAVDVEVDEHDAQDKEDTSEEESDGGQETGRGEGQVIIEMTPFLANTSNKLVK